MGRSIRTGLAGAAAGVVLLTVGCGGDDEGSPLSRPDVDEPAASTTTTLAPTGGEFAAYCDAALAIETVPEMELDPDLPEDEANAAAADWVTTELQPLVEAVVAEAPPEIEDDLLTQAAAVDQAAATGDFSSFGGPEVDAAEVRTHAFDVESCGWQVQDVNATEYSFGDIPPTVGAGPTSFELINDGAELHEMVLARKNPGVTETVEELAALPDEEAQAKVTTVGSVYTDPDTQDYVVVDLEAGDYVMLCFVPMGMTSEDDVPPDSAPHYTEGMLAEFTVG